MYSRQNDKMSFLFLYCSFKYICYGFILTFVVFLVSTSGKRRNDEGNHIAL